MKNIIKHIKNRCPECECSPEKIVGFLAENGDISYTSEYYREVWHHYLEECKYHKRPIARRRTEQLFKIHRNTLSKIINRYGRV